MQPRPLMGCFEFDVAFASPRHTRVGKLADPTHECRGSIEPLDWDILTAGVDDHSRDTAAGVDFKGDLVIRNS